MPSYEELIYELITSVRLCSTLECLLDKLEAFASNYGVEFMKKALYDERLLRFFAARSLDRDSVRALLRGRPKYYRRLLSIENIVVDAFDRASKVRLPPPPDWIVKQFAEKLAVGLNFCKTPECGLIKLSSVYAAIKEEAKTWGWDSNAFLVSVLLDPRVYTALHRLFDVEPSLYGRGNPRFGGLEAVWDLIDNIYVLTSSGRGVLPSAGVESHHYTLNDYDIGQRNVRSGHRSSSYGRDQHFDDVQDEVEVIVEVEKEAASTYMHPRSEHTKGRSKSHNVTRHGGVGTVGAVHAGGERRFRTRLLLLGGAIIASLVILAYLAYYVFFYLP